MTREASSLHAFHLAATHQDPLELFSSCSLGEINVYRHARARQNRSLVKNVKIGFTVASFSGAWLEPPPQDGICGKGLGHDCSSCNDGMRTDSHSGEDDCPIANPAIIANCYRARWLVALQHHGCIDVIRAMIDRIYPHSRRHHDVVADGNISVDFAHIADIRTVAQFHQASKGCASFDVGGKATLCQYSLSKKASDSLASLAVATPR